VEKQLVVYWNARKINLAEFDKCNRKSFYPIIETAPVVSLPIYGIAKVEFFELRKTFCDEEQIIATN
jgi:hypothetical protein